MEKRSEGTDYAKSSQEGRQTEGYLAEGGNRTASEKKARQAPQRVRLHEEEKAPGTTEAKDYGLPMPRARQRGAGFAKETPRPGATEVQAGSSRLECIKGGGRQ